MRKTKEELIKSLNESVKLTQNKATMAGIEALKKIDLPDLNAESQESYAVRYCYEKNGLLNWEILKRVEFWDTKLDCWNTKNTEIVATVEVGYYGKE